jgi:hypothetical protein
LNQNHRHAAAGRRLLKLALRKELGNGGATNPGAKAVQVKLWPVSKTFNLQPSTPNLQETRELTALGN